jgi:hypothetical protein
VKCTLSAVKENKFKYLIAEERASRMLKSEIQETEHRVETNHSLSGAPAFTLH